jgi:hypothetical protein
VRGAPDQEKYPALTDRDRYGCCPFKGLLIMEYTIWKKTGKEAVMA